MRSFQYHLSLIHIFGGDASLACSAETQTKIDALVVALVKREHEKAVKLLNDHRSKLDELSKYLYEKETITGEEFMKILNLEKAQDKGPQSQAPAARPQSPAVRGFPGF